MDRLPKNFLKENLRRPRLSEKESEPVSSAVSGAIERLVVVVAGPGIQEPESQWDRRLIGTVPALRTDREVMVNPAGVCRFQLAANEPYQGLLIWVFIHAVF